MAKIYIRGHQHPQTVSIKVAKEVDEIKGDTTKDNNYYIRLDGFSCDKGDVKSVVIYDTDDGKSERSNEKQNENGEKISRYQKEFVDEVNSYLRGNLEKKLQFNLRVAKFYCFSLTGKDVEEYKPQLKTIFIEELKKEKLIVNPTKYLKLFKIEEMESNDGLTKVDYLVRKAPLRLMQNYLMEVHDVIK